jgi:ribonuclease HI
VGWFGGAANSNGNHSGVGGVIRINDFFEYKWTFNYGPITNTRVELLGVWATLILAS